jgi:hypothetical protein
MATYDRLKAATAAVVAAVDELAAQPPPTPTPTPTPSGNELIDPAAPLSGWGGESDHAGGAWAADNGVLSAAGQQLVVTSALAHQQASAVKQVTGLPAGQKKTLTVKYAADGSTPVSVSVLSFAGGLTRLVDERNLSGSGTLTKAFTVPADGVVSLYLTAASGRDGVVRFSSATIS